MNLAEGESSRYHLCLPVPHGGGPSRVRQTKGCVHPKRCNVRTRHSLLAFAFSLLLRAVFRRLHCRPLAPTGASLKHNRRVLGPITAFNKRYCIISHTGCQGVVHIECARKNSIVKCNNFLLIFLYILSHHNKAVNIHSFVGSLL